MKKYLKKIAQFFYRFKKYEVVDMTTNQRELAVTHRIMDIVVKTTYTVLQAMVLLSPKSENQLSVS